MTNSKSNVFPIKDELKEFIGEANTTKVLSRQLAAVNLSLLKDSGVLDKLVEFVRESFKCMWNQKDLKAIKSLDRITKNLKILSRSGKNIANF